MPFAALAARHGKQNVRELHRGFSHPATTGFAGQERNVQCGRAVGDAGVWRSSPRRASTSVASCPNVSPAYPTSGRAGLGVP